MEASKNNKYESLKTLMLDSANDSIFLIDLDGNIIYVNQSAYKSRGYTKDELLSMSLRHLLFPEVQVDTPQKDVIKPLINEIKKKSPYIFESTHYTKEGSLIYVEITSKIINLPPKNFILLIVHDITDRRKSEDALKVREKQIELITSSMSDVIGQIDYNGIVTYISPSVEHLTGFAVSDYEGKPAVSLVHPDDVEKVKKSIQYTILTKKDVTMEYRALKSDGDFIWVETNGRTLLNNSGDFKTVVFAIRNISDRKKTEEKFRNALDNMMEGCQIINHEWRYIYVNDAAARHGKTKKEDLIGDNMMEKYPGIEDTKMFEKLEFVMEKRKACNFDNYFLYPDGSGRWFELRAFPVPEGIFILSIDIHDRKTAEEELLLRSEIIENMADGVSLAKVSDGKFVYINPKFEEIFGYNPGEVKGRTIKQFAAPLGNESAEEIADRIIKTLLEERVWNGEMYLKKKDGTFLWTYANISIYKHYKYGEVFVAVHSDITERKKAQEKLKTNEERLRFITENMTDVIGQIDQNGVLTYFSPSLKNLTGWNPEDVVGKPASDIVHPEDKEHVNSAINQAITSNEMVTVEYRALKADGGYVWVEATGNAVYDENGEFKSLVFTRRNISDRKKAEIKLKESEEKYRNIIETTQEGVWIIDADLKTNYVNQAMAEMLGMETKEMLGKPLSYFINDVDAIMKRRNQGIKEVFDHRFPLQDGGELWAMISVNPVFDEKGEFSGALAMLMDITKRKQVENALKESEEKYKNLFEKNPDYTILLDEAGFIFDLNIAAQEVTGLSKENTIGKHFTKLEIFPKGELEKFGKFFKMEKGEEIKPYEMRIFDKNKDIRLLEVTHTPLAPEDKTYHLLICKDITERKKMEKDVQDYLSRLNIALEAAGMGIWDLDMVHDTSIRTPDHDKIFGYETLQPQWGFKELFQHIIPEERPKIQKIVKTSAGKEKVHFQCRIRRADGEIRWIDVYGKVFYDDEGHGLRTLGVVNDITPIKDSERELKLLLKDKETLLREIHHRVKNNMQIIISLLNLQTGYVKEKETKNVLKDSQNRVKSMAMIHEKLYISSDLSHINFREYTEKLVSDIFYSYGIQKGTIIPVLEVEDIQFNMETAIPLGLIINELVSNSLKYAFPQIKKGKITVTLETNPTNHVLIVADDGIGLPENFDFKKSTSLGLQLVNSLVSQLNGQMTTDTTHGTKYEISFQELDYKERF